MINEVVPGLYIGDLLIAQNKQMLQKIGITHIVNLTDGNSHFPNSFHYYHYSLSDKSSQNILSRKLAAVMQFIHQAIGKDDGSKKSDYSFNYSYLSAGTNKTNNHNFTMNSVMDQTLSS